MKTNFNFVYLELLHWVVAALMQWKKENLTSNIYTLCISSIEIFYSIIVYVFLKFVLVLFPSPNAILADNIWGIAKIILEHLLYNENSKSNAI